MIHCVAIKKSLFFRDVLPAVLEHIFFFAQAQFERLDRKLPTYPSLKSTFCLKRGVGVISTGLGEG